MKSWKYTVRITRCIDGDTFVCENFDLGMGVYLNKVTLRLYGANTWESRTKNLEEKKRGLEAKRIVKDLIEGKEVEIETLSKPDKFGRTLARVRCSKGDLAQFLISEKLAYTYYGETKKKFPGSS